MKINSIISFVGAVFATFLSAYSWALNIQLTHSKDVEAVQAKSLQSIIEEYVNFQPSCFSKPEQLKVFVIPESAGASSSIVTEGGPDDEITISAIEVPLIYFANDKVLGKSRNMSEIHRNAVIYHELSHGLFNSSLKPREVKNVWPEGETLVEFQKEAERKMDSLLADGKTMKDPEMKVAYHESEKAKAAVDQLWLQNPDKAKKFAIYRNNQYLFSAITELMADLMTVVYLKNPELIMQALLPFPNEHLIESTQLRKFLPFNPNQLKEILDPIYYSDVPGYQSLIENKKEFAVYRSEDIRDAHLVLAPTRIFIWNRYFKGKNIKQQNENLCQILNVINEQFNTWGAWDAITPLQLNKKIIDSLDVR
jgi:hypothetical protein